VDRLGGGRKGDVRRVAVRRAGGYNAAMLCEAIDHAVLLVPDVAAAAEPFERLGLALTTGRSALLVGCPGQRFRLQLHAASAPTWLAPDEAEAPPARLAGVALRTSDLAAARDELARQGARASWLSVLGADGGRTDGLRLEERARLGADVLLVQSAEPSGAEPPRHALPLRRLDHLAILADDLDARTQDWAALLGVRVSGEVRSEYLLIRQLKIGDAVLELLAPAGPHSPLAGQPPGLRSVASFQVDDLDAAVEHARSRGFTPAPPAPGPLPATRIATLPADQLSGLNLQLLQHLDTRRDDAPPRDLRA
jgi:catechol 2,3-dioxygenase-like lactoylglutathione lyase family enzyme